MHSLRWFSQWSLILIFFIGLSRGQDFAGFRGKITDPSGLPVPGAEVTVTEETSGLSKSAISDDAGEYELRGILPGAYTLEVQLPGFKKYVNKGVIVYSRDVRRVDVKLDVGEVADSITVEEEGGFRLIQPRLPTNSRALRFIRLTCRIV